MALADADDEASFILAIASPSDVERSRREARGLAARIGFSLEDTESIVLAVSELATNLLRFAPGGTILARTCHGVAGKGIMIESRDSGPGIVDVDLALQDGYSTGGGLGSGLPAVRRLMDDFALSTGPAGTHIEARKWLKRSPHSRLP